MVKNVVDAYWQIAPGKKTLVFNVNIEHNNIVTHALKMEGLNVYSIDGLTPKNEREEILKKFSIEPDAIICNVGVLTTGFDEPTIESIILNRATKSLSLYLQMIGRGSRISENKQHFTVIDLGLNVKRHGFYNDTFDWETYFKFGKSKGNGKQGAMPVKECPKCSSLIHTRIMICPDCGHEFQSKEEKEAEEKKYKIIELLKINPPNIPIDKILELAKEKNYKPFYVVYKIATHVVNYENNHKVDLIENYDVIKDYMEKWCKAYGKTYNRFWSNILKEKINEIRGQNTAGNSNGSAQQAQGLVNF
jgi:superfamily II DNA or RNA helicase